VNRGRNIDMSKSELPSQDAKVTPASDPKKNEWPAYRAAYNGFIHARMIPISHPHPHPLQKTPSSRDVVRNFLSALSPTKAAPPILSKDIERLGRVVKSVIQAVDDNILSEEEANAVIEFIGDRFAQRRFDEIFSKVTMPKSGAWFTLHRHSEK